MKLKTILLALSLAVNSFAVLPDYMTNSASLTNPAIRIGATLYSVTNKMGTTLLSETLNANTVFINSTFTNQAASNVIFQTAITSNRAMIYTNLYLQGLTNSELQRQITTNLTLQGQTNTALQFQISTNLYTQSQTNLGLQTSKADKVVGAADNNIAVLDASGNLVDGGSTIAEISAVSLPTSGGTMTGTLTATNLVITGELLLTNSVWDDVVVSALTLRDPPGGTTPPDMVLLTNGFYAASFTPGASAYAVIQLSHQYKSGSDISPHLHSYAPATTITTNTWVLTGAFGRVGSDFTNLFTRTVISTNPARLHHMPTFSVLSGLTNKMGQSSIIGFTVSNSGPATVQILDIDFHYQIDKLGSDDTIPTGI